MNKAFVKGADEEGEEDLPELAISPYPNFVTKEGLAQIEKTIHALEEQRDAATASGEKDVHARTLRDLRYWNARLTSAHLTEPPRDTKTVQFGSTVTIEREDGRTQTFRIVGEDEADPKKGTVSHAAPLALALIGKETGEVVKVNDQEIEITRIG